MEFAFLLVGIIAGAAVGFLFGKRGSKTSSNDEELAELKVANAILAEGERRLTEERNNLKSELKNTQDELFDSNGRLEKSIEKFRNQETRLSEQKQEFEELNKRFNTEFE
ncbi:MAG: hypothetical protein ACPGU4_09785, partial [Flavobacteriales bacterium]